MKNKKIAILALTLGMVGAIGLSACGGNDDVSQPQGQTFATKKDWDSAIFATAESTNATITFEATFENREGEYFEKEEGSGTMLVADGKVYHVATGTTSTNSGSQPFTSESYMVLSEGVATEWHKENDGAWESMPCDYDFNPVLGEALGFFMDLSFVDNFIDFYSYCEVENASYFYIINTDEVYYKDTLRFTNGKLSYFESVSEHTYEADGVTYTMSVKMCFTVSYGNATVELPSEIAPDIGGDNDEESGIPSTEGVKFELSADGKYYVVKGYEGTSKEVYISAMHEGLPVKKIVDPAFYRNEVVTSVVIAEGVEEIGQYAFYHCAKLKSITIPKTVRVFGDSAFWECYDLKEVHITDLVAWSKAWFDSYDANPLYAGKNLYLNGNLVTELVVPKEVVNISNYAFSYCWSLTKITIANGVDGIGEYAFWDCKNVTELIIEDSNKLLSIGKCAFRTCVGLTSVVLHDNVRWLDRNAFQDCKNLVVYGEVEEEPYNWDTALMNVYYYSENEPSLNSENTAYNGKYWHYGAGGEILVWEYNANN